MVQRAPRRADDDLRAAAQGRKLAVKAFAAVKQSHGKGVVKSCELVEFAGDLNSQLPGRQQHEHLGVSFCFVDCRDRGDREGEGLARPGLRTADDVFSL